MHLPDKQPDSLTHISTTLKTLTTTLCDALPATPVQPVAPCSDIFSTIGSGDPHILIRLVSGKLLCKQANDNIYFLEPGDLIGLHRSLGLPFDAISAEEPVEVQVYNYSQLQQCIADDNALLPIWSQYLIYSASFFRLALSQEIRRHHQPPTGFLNFSAGDTIIQQDTQADCVYTMLEGCAVAYRDNVEVNVIIPEQIFGALAVFTRQTRSTSVVAKTDCTVLAVRQEDFIELIEHQPHVCMSLIEEMADRIHQLNQRVAANSGSPETI